MELSRALPFVLAICIMAGGSACNLGDFYQSKNGECPTGTALVKDISTCQKVTKLDNNVIVEYSSRTPPCKFMADLPFGCHKFGKIAR